MSQPRPDQVRFAFHTQLPRDDGCGIRVLQMLTGIPYDRLAAMVDWGDRSVHYMRWEDVRSVLTRLGWPIGAAAEAHDWREIQGVAIVHVEGDHFILYDADNGLFYDPGVLNGPDVATQHVPISHLPV